MLPRVNRLSRAEIDEIIRRGRRAGGRPLGLRYLPVPGPARFAIVVPAKEVKQSVARHRLKRRIRVLIREQAGQSKPSRSCHAVIFAGSSASQLPFPDLREQLTQLFKQIQ